jgi:MFS family permease
MERMYVCRPNRFVFDILTSFSVFHNPNSTILGLMSSLYSLGSLASLPFVPWVTDRLGRRMAILVGSIIMIIGAVLQMAAQDCEFTIFHFRPR